MFNIMIILALQRLILIIFNQLSNKIIKQLMTTF